MQSIYLKIVQEFKFIFANEVRKKTLPLGMFE